MQTIWFNFAERALWRDALSVNVEGIKRAQAVWDRLNAAGFHMISSRP